MSLYVGIDIGGTNIKIGILNDKGEILCKKSKSIQKDRTCNGIIQIIYEIFHSIITNDINKKTQIILKDIKYIGVGCPGEIKNGLLITAANFPFWKNEPLEKEISKILNLPTILVNDAEAAVASEQWIGVAKNNVKDFIMLTLGTGIGCGIVCNGKIIKGISGAVEGGHMIVEKNGRSCGCSQNGCLEAYSSATSMIKQATIRINQNNTNETILSKYIKQENFGPKEIFICAEKKDELANEIMNEACDYLGLACVNYSRILDPEMIILSGGIAEANERILVKIKESYNRHTWTKFPNPVSIVKATCGYDAGIVGAAYVALLQHKK